MNIFNLFLKEAGNFSPDCLSFLPQEIWNKILDYLNYEELKSASLVSKRWNSDISSYANFINRTKFHVNVGTSECLKVLKNSQRNYDHVIDVSKQHKYFLKTFLLFSNITTLELCYCRVVGSEFLKLLGECSTIKALIIRGIDIAKRERCCEPVKVNLTDVILEHTDDSTDWIFNHLKCPEISNLLQISCLSFCRNAKSVMNFLEQISGFVRALHIINCVNLDRDTLSTQFVPQTAPFIRFKWKFFHIQYVKINFGLEDCIVGSALRTLCRASSKNSSLKLSNVNNNKMAKYSVSILEICTSISSLEIEGDLQLFTSSNLFSDLATGILKPIRSIENLTLSNTSFNSIDSDVMTLILKMLPNVENISIEFDDMRSLTLSEIVLIGSKVKRLTIDPSRVYPYESSYSDFINNNYYRIIKIPGLESITLGLFAMYIEFPQVTTNLLRDMLKFHSQIKKIVFIEIGRLNQSKLKEFLSHVFENINLTVERIDIVRENSFCHFHNNSVCDVPRKRIYRTIASKHRI